MQQRSIAQSSIQYYQKFREIANLAIFCKPILRKIHQFATIATIISLMEKSTRFIKSEKLSGIHTNAFQCGDHCGFFENHFDDLLHSNTGNTATAL